MAQTAQKQTAEYAQAKLDALIASGGRYGVPVVVLRPDDAGLGPALEPDRISVHGRTGRVYTKKLRQREKEFLQNSLDIALSKGNGDRHDCTQIFDRLEKSWAMQIAYGGARVLCHPDNSTLEQKGRENYKEKDFALIIHCHSDTTKHDWATLFLSPKSGVELQDLPGTAAHWSTWVLEHEMAHTAGAGEAQADIMAAAHYIRTFDDTSLTTAIADIRAVNAVTRHTIDSYSDTYGWTPVAALDALMAKGTDSIKTLNDTDIHNLRFEHFDGRRKDVDDFADTLARCELQHGRMRKLSFKTLLAEAEKLLQGDKLKNKPGAQEIGQRFVMALRRLSNTPAPQPTHRTQPGRTQPGRTQPGRNRLSLNSPGLN